MPKLTKEEEEKRLLSLWEIEGALLKNNISPIAGVDEAGRGPLAGAVYAAAVILPPFEKIPYLNDSKKLSEKRREELYDIICERALAYAVATASPEEIDGINIRNATYLAMNRAIGKLKETPGYVLVDGDAITNCAIAHECVIKGDAKSASIAAASILAKVSRDRYMKELDEKYPEYQFAKHKGYGTALHIEMLKKYGPCEEHRRTFIKKFV